MMNDQMSDICIYLDYGFHFQATLIVMVDAPSLVSHSQNNKKRHFYDGVQSYHCQTV